MSFSDPSLSCEVGSVSLQTVCFPEHATRAWSVTLSPLTGVTTASQPVSDLETITHVTRLLLPECCCCFCFNRVMITVDM